jgi:hypothetical protein
MSDAQLSFRKSANIDRVTDKRKDSLFRLVDTDGSGTIDAQEFAVLYDAIKKDLAEELEKEAALQQEASSARRRFKMLLLFVAVLVSFLAASVAANFAVIFTVVDQAVTTTTTSSGLLEVKGTGAIAKTAIATEDLPLIAAPALDLDTLAQVKSLKVTYGPEAARVEAQLNIVGVRKHNSTFVEFITDVPGETVETLNGKASLVRYTKLDATRPKKHELCSANATCSAFSASGIDAEAVVESAISSLVEHGFVDESRRLQVLLPGCVGSGSWTSDTCTGSACGTGIGEAEWVYHTGYTGRLHVVFGLHGLRDTGDGYCGKCQMDKCCGEDYANGPCDNLAIDEFEHLVFVFPSSSYSNDGSYTWSGTNGDSSTYTVGLGNLATFMCGSSDAFSSSCPGGGVIGGVGLIDTTSEVMIMGMSNGGGAATFGVVKYAKITAAVAVDFYGPCSASNGGCASMASWLPGNAGPSLPWLKIYTACDSQFYMTDGVTSGATTFASVFGLSAGTAYNMEYPEVATAPAWFQEYPFTSSDSELYFAVHGGGTACNVGDTTICHEHKQEQKSNPNYQCDGLKVHNWLNKYADYPNDVLEWVAPPAPPPSPPSSTGPTVYTPRIKPSKPTQCEKGKPCSVKGKKLPMVTGLPPMAKKPEPKIGSPPAPKVMPKLTKSAFKEAYKFVEEEPPKFSFSRGGRFLAF